MEKRMGAFKESVAQLKRCKAVSDWRKEMTASAFVPSLDLVSMPPKILSSWSFADVSGCETLQDLRQVALPVLGIVSKTYTEASDGQEKRKKYFLPLLEATTTFYAAVAATDSSAVLLGGANQCNYGLRLVRDLAARDDTDLSYQECVRLEELLYILRLVLHKVPHFRTKAANLAPGIVKLFPQAVRPSFSYPTGEPKQSKQQKKDQSKQEKKKKKKKRKKHQA
ncbi:hypothetical protein PR003_g31402 [Phytophthora rubi]|uniref:Uncharacterized protein n=1 Tax=Phytophthora rubi TaxID=129364 RepID=A0A6A3GU25_9STRA|nr:hypothetical protein PR002_g30233 [Phytophthora rubi]KAE9268574.1 hypothetical protein PR003_g31402 [Phytophthora rubi]